MPRDETDLGVVFRDVFERLRMLARRHPWWPLALAMLILAWWLLNRLETQKICLQAGFAASATAWDGTGYCLYRGRAVPVKNYSK